MLHHNFGKPTECYIIILANRQNDHTFRTSTSTSTCKCMYQLKVELSPHCHSNDPVSQPLHLRFRLACSPFSVHIAGVYYLGSMNHLFTPHNQAVPSVLTDRVGRCQRYCRPVALFEGCDITPESPATAQRPSLCSTVPLRMALLAVGN